MRAHGVRALLMGGQACVFYGAAEFNRDTDFAILADARNLARLRKALDELRAEPMELRTPELLMEVARTNPKLARRLALKRPLLRHAPAGQMKGLSAALAGEESAEREKDRLHWLPLKKELEQLRHSRIKKQT